MRWSESTAPQAEGNTTGRSAAAAADPVLRAQALTLEYRTPDRVVRATHEVDFSVQEGDRFVLLGPSGCGKSTLLKAVAGFVQPAAGRILLDGKQVERPGADRVVVFQEFDQLWPWLTVRQNIAFPLRQARGLSRKEAAQRAEHYLDKVGLARFADAHPHTLSGGMKQRVAIARALAMRPRILLMDEPFAALDALTRRRMQQELLELWEDAPFTLLFVTHSIEEALLVGNRILLLSPHPGRVRAELNSPRAGLHARDNPAADAEFQAQARRIHRLLFDEDEPGSAPAAHEEKR
ncbi:ABC transporter ATP-binding protein [Cupriavidus sp. AU9028]|uniref:ABC transporter ATP-binding protein n=1 Tax=Cupriavidus sp. AU9028 TaxID=2871157 RepID=UPI001C94A0FF|nr:ABC transporter ATP-binding protein [Cupriavidus sp. AU9028]MBY4896110.1 ABC transporter ATP-binding protein [Cupriavidus sp. AU9028]